MHDQFSNAGLAAWAAQSAQIEDHLPAFLSWLRPGGPWVLTAITPDNPSGGSAPTRTFSDLTEAAAWINEQNKTRNIYYQSNPTKTALSHRATKQDIARIDYLHADCDPDKNETAAVFKARMLPQLQGFKPPPTAIIDSGNGLQLLWALTEPAPCDTPEQIAAIEANNQALAATLGADPVTRNIDRLLRLPGTINRPNKKKREAGRVACPARLVDWTGLRYPLSAFPQQQPKQASGNDDARDGSKKASESDLINNILNGTELHNSLRNLAAKHAARGKPAEETEQTLRRLMDKSDAPRDQRWQDRYDDIPKLVKSAIKKVESGSWNKGPALYDPGNDGPIALGFTRDGTYAFRDRGRNLIISASANQLLSPQWLPGLMPSRFWRKQFPADKGPFNPFAAGEALIAACKRSGAFNPQRVRGRGIWREGDAIIINLGGPVPANSRYHYLCFEPVRLLPDAEFDAERLLRLLQLFNWKDQRDAVLLFGWIAYATVCGVFDWRPPGWVTGAPHTGKTTLHNLIKYLLVPDQFIICPDGSSSEAGIRQRIGGDSVAVMLDEAESDQDRVASKVRFIRSATSSDDQVLRGTPEGRAIQFSLRAAFLLLSVTVGSLSPADQSRFLIFELDKHNDDKQTAATIEAELAHFHNLGPQWCSRMVSLAPLMQPALATFQQQMPSADRNFQQNFATILGAAFVALHGRAPTAEEAAQQIADYMPTMTRHGNDSKRDDEAECLEKLTSFIVDRYTLGRWIATVITPPLDEQHVKYDDAQNILYTYGIAVKEIDGDTMVCIRNTSSNIETIYRNSSWRARGWQRALRRLDGAYAADRPVRFGVKDGDKHRATLIPARLFTDAPVEEKPYEQV